MSTPASGTVRAYRRGDQTDYTAIIQAINEDGTVSGLAFSTASQPHQAVTLHVIEPGTAPPVDAEWWCEAGAFTATPVARRGAPVAGDVGVGDVADGDVTEPPPADPTPAAPPPAADAGGGSGGDAGDRLAPMAERVDTLTARVDALTAQVDQHVVKLGEMIDALSARVNALAAADDNDGDSLLT